MKVGRRGGTDGIGNREQGTGNRLRRRMPPEWVDWIDLSAPLRLCVKSGGPMWPCRLGERGGAVRGVTRGQRDKATR